MAASDSRGAPDKCSLWSPAGRRNGERGSARGGQGQQGTNRREGAADTSTGSLFHQGRPALWQAQHPLEAAGLVQRRRQLPSLQGPPTPLTYPLALTLLQDCSYPRGLPRAQSHTSIIYLCLKIHTYEEHRKTHGQTQQNMKHAFKKKGNGKHYPKEKEMAKLQVEERYLRE